MNKNVQYSRKVALNQRKWGLLLRSVWEMDCNLFKLKSQSIAFLGGQVSPGETTDIHEDWLNWRGCGIDILPNDPYNQGRERGPCDSCRRPVRQRAEYHDTTLGEVQIRIVKLVQLLDVLQKSVQLLPLKGKHLAQETDL